MTRAAPGQLWRIGWGTDPNGGPAPDPLDLANSTAGNRYDSITGGFTVTYAATTRATALLESTAQFRVDPALAPYVADWTGPPGHLPPGSVPASWRHKRTWACWSPAPEVTFLDLAHHSTVAWINTHATALLATLGHGALTVADLTGTDRALTRAISSWVHTTSAATPTPLAGIRYPSKHGTDLECWAIYDRAAPDFVGHSPILLTDAEIPTAETAFGITFQ